MKSAAVRVAHVAVRSRSRPSRTSTSSLLMPSTPSSMRRQAVGASASASSSFSTTTRSFDPAKPQDPHTSSSSSTDSSGTGNDNGKQKDQKEQAKARAEEPVDTTVPGRSPFQAFVDVLRAEVRKNREWQDSVKQLQGEASKVQDSEAMRKTKELYERARLQASIENNPKLAAAARELKKAGVNVNDAITHTIKTMEENAFVKSAGRAISASARVVGDAAMTASEPLRKTEAYKAVASEISEAIDSAANNVQHGGYIEKDARRRRREARLEKAGKSGQQGLAARRPKVEEDPLAGQAVTLHATANVEKKSRFAPITPKPVADAFSSLSHAYAESENPFVSSMRTVTSAIGRFFDETETAKVAKWVKELDPSFTTEGFLRELREYIVPELVDAYVNGDQPTLKAWCSEATYNVLMATLQGTISPTLVSESRVLDIRNLDIMSAKILENDLHVFVVAWRTQEILAYRDIKTGKLAVGDENKIEQVGYVAVLTRIDEELDNKVTGGWKVIDMARRAG
ncbi:BQ5605_C024g09870 [Microbotryum silenes-dioicae]|uniref:Mitochondrial import inner membrane translocase subunit TIM44 n=1 Tax=Microbotryum silenes-dioicae TaxID=796604 RepID=A0A2X0PM56_9BASI|nr:BQ5605_C024g09870 [Microbotryum silenes-dioicae]